jgi:hypothetical protein
MTPTSPFDHRPDPVLGAALRAALATDDDAAFTRRVVAAAEADLGSAGLWYQELSAWARPGLVAALLAVAAAGFWLGAMAQGRGAPVNGATALGDPLTAADSDRLAVPVLLAEEEAPEVDLVLGLVTEH